MRPFKHYTWKDLIRGRDAYLILIDMGFIKSYECNEIDFINDEIDIRFKERIVI